MEIKLPLKTKLILAIVIVIASLLLGFYTKFVFFLHLPNYIDFWSLFWYIISWVMLFVAAFFVGKEVLEIADQYVKKKLQESYDKTIELHKTGFQKGVETTKKGYETTKALGKRTFAFQKKMLGIKKKSRKK